MKIKLYHLIPLLFIRVKRNQICLLLVLLLTNSFGQSKKPNYDGSFIQFHLYGKGEPVFVLSGGPGNNCRQLEDLAIKLGEQFQAILLEQRGTGLSMPKRVERFND